jgi:phosphopantetheinyl transferase
MSSRIVIERIAAEDILRENATAEDLAFVAPFGSASRRREALAWRAIVRRELGADVVISYDDYGAPRVSVPNTYISVSHSRESVALLVSDNICAVDIEQADRDFSRVANRYLSQSEQMLAEQNDLYAEMWCAKEALYKYYSKGEIDLVKHLSIKEYNSANGVLVCSILEGEPIEVKVMREESLAMAVID